MDKSFDLKEEVLKLHQHSSYFISNELHIEHWNDDLDELTDAWSEDSSTIADPILFDMARSYIKNFHDISNRAKNKLVLIIIAGLKNYTSQCREDETDKRVEEEQDKDGVFLNMRKELLVYSKPFLELYMFLLVWMIEKIETTDVTVKAKSAGEGFEEVQENLSKIRKSHTSTKGRKEKNSKDDEIWIWSRHRQRVLETMLELMQLDFNCMYELKTERDIFVK
jgi:hypothetical protein